MEKVSVDRGDHNSLVECRFDFSVSDKLLPEGKPTSGTWIIPSGLTKVREEFPQVWIRGGTVGTAYTITFRPSNIL
jgi:hypothetical protein